MIKWTTLATRRDWDGDTGGYGLLRIQRSGKKPSRYYLAVVPWFGDWTMLGNYASLQAAKDAAEAYVNRLR